MLESYNELQQIKFLKRTPNGRALDIVQLKTHLVRHGATVRTPTQWWSSSRASRQSSSTTRHGPEGAMIGPLARGLFKSRAQS